MKTAEDSNKKLVTLRLDDVTPNPDQPRQHFDEEELQQLAQSIKDDGLRKPIDVRPITGGKYELVDGERRYRAHKILNLQEIQAIIHEDVKSRKEATKQAILLNEFYKAHTPQETERAIYRLVHEAGMSIREIAQAIGKKSPGSVEAYLKAYKFRQKLPFAMANSPKLTTSILKHTDTIKGNDSLRTRIVQMLMDGKITQNAVSEVAQLLEKVPPEREEVFEAYSLGMLTSAQLHFLLEGAPLGKDILLMKKPQQDTLARHLTERIPKDVKKRLLYLTTEKHEKPLIEETLKDHKERLQKWLAEEPDKSKHEEIRRYHHLQTYDTPDNIHDYFERYSFESIKREFEPKTKEEELEVRNSTEAAWLWWAIQWWLAVRLGHNDKISQIGNEELAIKVIDLVTEAEHWETFKRSIDEDQRKYEEWQKGGVEWVE